jgi:hypothetical protein
LSGATTEVSPSGRSSTLGNDRVSPVGVGDERVLLSMTLCTDPRIHPIKELVRRVKDTAYYGPRALID